jgi:N-acetylglucosamine-6-phosphate deacetylase
VPARPSSAALDLIRHATSHGVRVSVGHSNATAAETLAAIDAGAASATHTFNAMRALDHREPGILGTVLDDHRLFAELICDGVHVAPPLVRLWLRAKTAARAILVSDSISATGMPDGDYMLGPLHVTVANGVAQLSEDLATGKQTLAGSVLTLDRAVANLQAFTAASLAEATRLASHNPAAMLGMPMLTRLALGSSANLNCFNADNRLTATYIRGQVVPSH